jgi:hypothetical protein
MSTIEAMLEVVFSVGSTPRLYSEDPRPAEDFYSGLTVQLSSSKEAEKRWRCS